MPWASGTFTRDNGTYTGVDVWQNDADNAFDIEADRHDTHDQDLANGINATLNRYGENAIAANISWGGYLLTNLGNAVSSGDAVSKGYLETQFNGADSADFLKLSEVTATSAELNYVAGVTSAIQTQLDAKSPLDSPEFTTLIKVGDWELVINGTNLDLEYSGVVKARFTSSGRLYLVDHLYFEQGSL